MADPCHEIEAVYRTKREHLIRILASRFPSLGIDQCEDLVQLAFLQALEEPAENPGSVSVNWFYWLRRVSQNRAIDFIRLREHGSLEALQGNPAAGNDSDNPGWQPPDRGLTPSAALRQGERAERRRVLVSDILAAYVGHVERYVMHVQRQVFERSLRGQSAADVARDMGLDAQRVYEHRSKAFSWIRGEVQRRDSHGSILATVFGDRPVSVETAQIPPRRLHDLIYQAVDELGALCPSTQRLEQYRAAVQSGTHQGTACPKATESSDIHYHVSQSQWYLDDRDQTLGCRLCRDQLENPRGESFESLP